MGRIVLNTPADRPVVRHRECGGRGMTPSDLAKSLFDKYRVWTVAINRTRRVCAPRASQPTSTRRRKNSMSS